MNDPRYAGIDGEIPRTESLKLVIDRFLPYWESDIVPDLRAGKTVLVTAHGNSLRGLVKHLDGISDADIAELNIPTGIPLVYRLNEDLTPAGPGEYLDPEAAAAGAAAVAAQGKQLTSDRSRHEKSGCLPPGHPLFWSVGDSLRPGQLRGPTNVSSLSVVQSPVAR